MIGERFCGFCFDTSISGVCNIDSGNAQCNLHKIESSSIFSKNKDVLSYDNHASIMSEAIIFFNPKDRLTNVISRCDASKFKYRAELVRLSKKGFGYPIIIGCSIKNAKAIIRSIFALDSSLLGYISEDILKINNRINSSISLDGIFRNDYYYIAKFNTL